MPIQSTSLELAATDSPGGPDYWHAILSLAPAAILLSHIIAVAIGLIWKGLAS